jgi:hypothetical protein
VPTERRLTAIIEREDSANGDLKRKLLPELYRLMYERRLCPDSPS